MFLRIFVFFLYNACVGTVPIPYRAKFRADFVPCQIPCLPCLYCVCAVPNSGPTYLFCVPCPIPALPVCCTCQIPCNVRAVPNSGPNCLFFVHAVPIPCYVRAVPNSGPNCFIAACFEVCLCPACHQKTWGRCRGSYITQLLPYVKMVSFMSS